MGEVLGLANQNLHIAPPASPRINLIDPGLYLQFSATTLDSAELYLFLHFFASLKFVFWLQGIDARD